MADLMDDMNEINEALGQNFAMPDDLDEAELDAELDLLGDELEDELLAEADSTPSYLLPAQPNGAKQTTSHSTIGGRTLKPKFTISSEKTSLTSILFSGLACSKRLERPRAFSDRLRDRQALGRKVPTQFEALCTLSLPVSGERRYLFSQSGSARTGASQHLHL